MICTKLQALRLVKQAEQATRGHSQKATKRALPRLLKDEDFATFDNQFDSDKIDISVMNTDKTVTRIRKLDGWVVEVC